MVCFSIWQESANNIGDSTIKTGIMNNKLHGLDHLRALAIVLVFFFHYYIISGGRPEWLPAVASFGWVGVDLFFVLSGFLISSQLFQQINSTDNISLSVFFLKRLFRIVPAFLFTVGLYFAFPAFREKEALPPLWKFLSFTQNFGLNLKDYGTFSHAWSLCVEEHFYLLLPLILYFLLRFKRFSHSYWLLLLFFVAGFAVRQFSFDQLYLPHAEDDNNWLYWYKFIYYPTYNRLDGLLAGVAIAAMREFRPRLWDKIAAWGNWHIVVGLLILTAAYFLFQDPQSFPASVFGYPVIAIGFAFVTMGAISPGCFLYRWHSRATAWIATLSYALYLTHKGVIHFTQVSLRNWPINDHVILLLCLISSSLFAYLVHLAIEKPFMKMRHKLIEPEK